MVEQCDGDNLLWINVEQLGSVGARNGNKTTRVHLAADLQRLIFFLHTIQLDVP